MQNIKYFSYIISAFLLISCGEDFFDSVTEIEIPEHEPQLVLRAEFDATYLEFSNLVELRHTLGILDSTEFEEINDAEVELYEDGILKSTFEHLSESWYQGEIDNLEAGKTYTLKASSPTFGSVEASQEVPSKVQVIAATYEADGAVDRYGDRGDEVTIQFQDPAGETNYYLVNVSATYRFESPDTNFIIDNYGLYSSPVDPLLEDLNQLYLTDISFDGEMYTTRIRVNLPQAGTMNIEGARNLAAEKITAHLTSVSRDKYLFEKTFYAHRENDGNPFAEPVVIHENIEDGSGIFTLSVTDEFSVEL